MRWYADNSELNGIREAEIPDILLFGGYTVTDEQEINIRESIENIREKNFGSRRAPVKWNFKDLKDIYEKQGKQSFMDVCFLLRRNGVKRLLRKSENLI